MVNVTHVIQLAKHVQAQRKVTVSHALPIFYFKVINVSMFVTRDSLSKVECVQNVCIHVLNVFLELIAPLVLRGYSYKVANAEELAPTGRQYETKN